MNTFGLGNSNVKLTTWHKKQAAMLYHFTSLDYLKTLHRMVSDLINGVVDPLLEVAKAQNRDQVLVSKVWGNRNTSANWENHAWPFLKDLQTSLAKDIALRAAQGFRITAVNECLRGVEEYSLNWAAPSEEQMIRLALGAISTYAGEYDDTLEKYENRWTDFTFAYSYPAFASFHRQIPQFVIRGDVRGETGRVPPRTGVYISPDDPHATLQFAWTENGGAELREANTFNEIGLAALAAVGRASLWFDEGKMYDFATSKPYAARFHDSVFMHGEPYPALAPSAVARSAFTKRSCDWLLVELVPNEFVALDSLVEADQTSEIITRRIAGGERCLAAGFYLTPSAPNSRRFFAAGETVPRLDSPYGTTYWQWDANQDK